MIVLAFMSSPSRDTEYRLNSLPLLSRLTLWMIGLDATMFVSTSLALAMGMLSIESNFPTDNLKKLCIEYIRSNSEGVR